MFPNRQLRDIRLQRGLAQRALSVQANVSAATLHAAEKYGYVPGLPIRERIAAALGVDVEQLWPSDTAAVA